MMYETWNFYQLLLQKMYYRFEDYFKKTLKYIKLILNIENILN